MSIGRYLVQERELRGISREEVAALTKIPPTALRAIEEDATDRLPERVYLVGYLRAYAEAVGLDADDVVLRHDELAQDPADTAVAGSGRARAAGSRYAWTALAVLVAGVVAGAAYVLLG